MDQLLQKESSLRKQTKQLDTSLQMLVYENYNKFITATDTIKKMKQHVEGMEDEMKTLLQNMDKITVCSETINSNLQSKRDKIERLSNVNRTLKKMQFLLELPTRLNECIDMKKYSVAVKYYNIASTIFNKNSNLSGFKNIEKESTDVINKMKESIEKDMMNITSDNDPKTQDYLRILIDLDVPIEKVRDSYLKVRSDFIKNQMENVMKENENNKDVTSRVKALNNYFLKSVQSYYGTYQMTFLMNDPKIRKQITMEQLTKDFGEWAKQLFMPYFDNVRQLLLKSQATNEDLKLALQVFCNESISYIQNIPNTKLQDRVNNLVGDIVMTFLINQIDRVKKSTDDNLQKLGETPDNSKPNQLAKFVEDTIQRLRFDLDTCMTNYQRFLSIEDDATSPLGFIMQLKDKIFKNWIKSMCVEFIDSVLVSCKDFGIPHSKIGIFEGDEFKQRKVTSVGALLLAKLCTKLPLKDFKTMLREKFVPLEVSSKKGSRNRMSELDEEDTIFNIENMEIRMKECSSHLIVYYIEIQARNVAKLVRTGMETHNWLETDVPRDVRNVIRVTVGDLCNVRAQLVELFPPSTIHDTEAEKSDSGRSTRSSRSNDTSSFTYGGVGDSPMKYNQNSEVVKDVMKIFNKKLGSFTIKTPRYFQRAGDSSFSGIEILTEILKIVIKTMEECVRSVTFGKNGFQQLQVDIAFMQQKLANVIEDRSYIPSLVQEVMASCAERCFSATPLESTIVQSIVGKYLNEETTGNQ